jgi:hypothetical protein
MSYNVTVLDPGKAIAGVNQLMVGGGIGDGAWAGVAKYIEDQVVPSNATATPFASVFTGVGDSVFFPYATTTLPTPYQAVTIQDVVSLVGGEGGATLLKFVQTYDQVDVPEAASGSLMVFGAALGIVGVLRRRTSRGSVTPS